jgi:hypothetical protein
MTRFFKKKKIETLICNDHAQCSRIHATKYEVLDSRHTFGKSASFYKVKLAVRLKFKEFATAGFKRGIQL